MNPSPNPPSPFPSPTPNPNPPPQKPMDLVASALTHNSPTTLQQALDLFANNSRRGLTPTILDRVLNLAVKRAKPDLVRYLLDHSGGGGGMGIGCSIEKVRPWSVGVAVRGGGEEKGEGEEGHEGGKGKERGEEGKGEGKVKEGDVIKVLDVLVERGWDVNGRYTDRWVLFLSLFLFWFCRLRGRAERVGRWFWERRVEGILGGFCRILFCALLCFVHSKKECELLIYSSR